MKVLLASFDSIETLHGGVEWYVEHLSKALREEGIDARVASRANFALPRLPASHRTRLLLERPFALAIRKASKWADVVHGQNIDGAFSSRPMVATVHTTPLDEWASSRLGGWREAVYQRQIHALTVRRWQRVARRMKHAWTTGDHVAASLRQLGAPSVEVTSNPVPPLPKVPQAEARRELGLPDGPLVLYLGRLARVKRVERLLDATSATLVIAGEGPEEENLRRLAGANVRFMGRVDERVKALLYNAADVLVLPSEHEGQPLVLLEAMSVGTPIVATREEWVPRDLRRYGFFGDDYRTLIDAALKRPREAAPVLSYREAARRFARVYEEVAK